MLEVLNMEQWSRPCYVYLSALNIRLKNHALSCGLFLACHELKNDTTSEIRVHEPLKFFLY